MERINWIDVNHIKGRMNRISKLLLFHDSFCSSSGLSWTWEALEAAAQDVFCNGRKSSIGELKKRECVH